MRWKQGFAAKDWELYILTSYKKWRPENVVVDVILSGFRSRFLGVLRLSPGQLVSTFIMLYFFKSIKKISDIDVQKGLVHVRFI